jgi:hypothetical protein
MPSQGNDVIVVAGGEHQLVRMWSQPAFYRQLAARMKQCLDAFSYRGVLSIEGRQGRRSPVSAINDVDPLGFQLVYLCFIWVYSGHASISLFNK